ncbi:hypothetical protein GF359_00725 [candidate division WOR-3 bacterium]|uniref:Uncharacterized protein n=1 Tax=candidate division WOR-3 bacterium TaxID=2052148 RepID=A0A9D5QC67_UNCW3|nr:hypothetical protein [candidate division WOR-3 bacterium]MBD3363717.1 hypothetical protein [candidate division WOR-3 bacterium]
MKGLLAILLVVIVPAGAAGDLGSTVEKASVGVMFSVLTGFITGQLAWVASPKYEEGEEPYRVKLPAALAACYGVGVPLGASLGVHLASFTTEEESSFWARWAGAEIAGLAGSGISMLLVSIKTDTTEFADTPLEAVAAGLPIAFGVGGAFLGDRLARRWGLADSEMFSGMRDVRVALSPGAYGKGFSIEVQIPIN